MKASGGDGRRQGDVAMRGGENCMNAKKGKK